MNYLIKLGISIYTKVSTGVLSSWILATGKWRDEGIWDDTDVWNDS